jgi:hypothetical protein
MPDGSSVRFPFCSAADRRVRPRSPEKSSADGRLVILMSRRVATEGHARSRLGATQTADHFQWVNRFRAVAGRRKRYCRLRRDLHPGANKMFGNLHVISHNPCADAFSGGRSCVSARPEAVGAFPLWLADGDCRFHSKSGLVLNSGARRGDLPLPLPKEACRPQCRQQNRRVATDGLNTGKPGKIGGLALLFRLLRY